MNVYDLCKEFTGGNFDEATQSVGAVEWSPQFKVWYSRLSPSRQKELDNEMREFVNGYLKDIGEDAI